MDGCLFFCKLESQIKRNSIAAGTKTKYICCTQQGSFANGKARLGIGGGNGRCNSAGVESECQRNRNVGKENRNENNGY